MKIHVGPPFFTLAIFFSFIELCSQYNEDILVDEKMNLPYNLDIFYSGKNSKDILISDGHNQETYGLIHDDYDILVCELETYDGQTWLQGLLVTEIIWHNSSATYCAVVVRRLGTVVIPILAQRTPQISSPK
ncbi:uncharacterized protein LOC117172456 [Belonocnema kinseyi]|uniref:uncharacterized protein LOC117172456 n=1 Tax=Belonocnema kinseyi TaxID=2817044 RepID=UPI00143D8B4E|nr:uncharacterized protein LOC117172456 [Belonocnema kinseyi]XP_033216298.1 uncharacterized protein LOC117172456 [Belonocnema kinseyi]XP_033216299.1 uncharacterized protein LOC117172456 [Belonocnema kinseyi]XP_033216300.1 uncharacterized protein LOC117172456 [Belonocnema kinseyi]